VGNSAITLRLQWTTDLPDLPDGQISSAADFPKSSPFRKNIPVLI
jgi:hypothetical protein